MACLICGKSLVSEETRKHINNIEAKKVKIDEKIDSIFMSDVNRAVDLIIKSKKYDKEIKHLSTGTYTSKMLLCEKCYNEIERYINNKTHVQIDDKGHSRAKDFLKALKIFAYMADKSFFNLKHELDELREILCGLYSDNPNDINEIMEEKNNLINELDKIFDEIIKKNSR